MIISTPNNNEITAEVQTIQTPSREQSTYTFAKTPQRKPPRKRFTINQIQIYILLLTGLQLVVIILVFLNVIQKVSVTIQIHL